MPIAILAGALGLFFWFAARQRAAASLAPASSSAPAIAPSPGGSSFMDTPGSSNSGSSGNGVVSTPSFPSTAPSAPPARAVSPAGERFIQNEEKLSLSRYRDADGYSIGYGHFIKPGENIGQTITQAQAIALFRQDVANVNAEINRYVRVPLSQEQFDAIGDLVFNVGPRALWLGTGPSTLLTKLNARDYAGAADAFKLWVHSGGRVNPVLTARRARDVQLFNSGSALA